MKILTKRKEEGLNLALCNIECGMTMIRKINKLVRAEALLKDQENQLRYADKIDAELDRIIHQLNKIEEKTGL